MVKRMLQAARNTDMQSKPRNTGMGFLAGIAIFMSMIGGGIYLYNRHERYEFSRQYLQGHLDKAKGYLQDAVNRNSADVRVPIKLPSVFFEQTWPVDRAVAVEIDFIENGIRNWHLPYTILDSSGQKTEKNIKQELDGLVNQAKLQTAKYRSSR